MPKYFCMECRKEHTKKDDEFKLHKEFALEGKYFCSQCNGFHYRGKIYNEHREFALNLTKQELWKLQFNKSWKNYSIESHKKTSGSKKQMERSKFSRYITK